MNMSFNARKWLGSLAATLAIYIPSTAFSWGVEGHAIVATIAQQHLSATAKAQVQQLLDNGTMADVASWADEIRQSRPETASWHFVDIPLAEMSFDEHRDGNGGNNVVDKIGQFQKSLSDSTIPQAQRVEALKFLIHFVGDCHQPLHCAERDEDRGGNARLVFFLAQPKSVNLHFVWDHSIIVQELGSTNITVYASALNTRISAEQAQAWAQGTPQSWAEESHALAQSVAYNGVPENGPPPKLGPMYYNAAQPIVDQQLQRAGIRLAMILNDVFR